MYPLHLDEEVTLKELSYDMLVRRLEREKKARLAAETLLEEKSLELYEANRDLAAAAAKLERERSLLSAVFDARPAGLVLTDSALRLVRMNPAARSFFGLDGEVLPEAELTDFLTGEDRAYAWIRARSGQEPVFDDTTMDLTVNQREGEEIPVRMSCSPIGHGELRLWILLDIRRHLAIEAERQLLEQSLNQAQKMEALGTLASGVAHEINTPIQYVGDNVRFMQEVHEAAGAVMTAYDALTQAAKGTSGLEELVQAVEDQRTETDIAFLMEEAPVALDQSLHGLQQVASIVSAIREFSHPGETELKPIDINLVLETTMSVSRNSWKHVAEIDRHFAVDLPDVMGQPGDLHQVFLNLIGNATDAIEDSAPAGAGVIRIETRRNGSWIEISIADNGAGIDAQTRSRIFDPFFTTKEPGKGTGQGLAIVYKIVHVKHGGRIEVDSTPGKGTTFTVKLPVTPQQTGVPQARASSGQMVPAPPAKEQPEDAGDALSGEFIG